MTMTAPVSTTAEAVAPPAARRWWHLRRSSLAWGVVAVGSLATFYVTVITLASGFDHLRSQARTDWWLLAPIMAGFGTQVAVMAEVRRRHRAAHLTAVAGAGTGASAVGMVACCAHHLADLVPFVGLTGAAAFLLDWRVAFMLLGVVVNGAAIVLALGRLRLAPAPVEHEAIDPCAP